MVDIFDSLMNASGQVLRRPAGTNSYGHNTSAFAASGSAFPCRVSTTGFGRESKSEKKLSISQRIIYCRPIDVAHHDRIQVGANLYDVLDVKNPSGVDHHYEILVELVTP